MVTLSNERKWAARFLISLDKRRQLGATCFHHELIPPPRDGVNDEPSIVERQHMPRRRAELPWHGDSFRVLSGKTKALQLRGPNTLIHMNSTVGTRVNESGFPVQCRGDVTLVSRIT